MSDSAVSGTQLIQRAALILRLLTASHRTGMRLIDICASTALERSTAHRILQGLIAEKLAAQQPQTKRYFLGSAAYEMGLAAAPRFPLRDICHGHLELLAEKTGDTVFLVTRSGFDGVCIDRVEGSFPIRVFVLELGKHRPLNIGAGGMAIISTLKDDEIERICAVNQERVGRDFPAYSQRDLAKAVAHTRDKGYLVNNVLEVANARALAAPIRAPLQNTTGAAISLSSLASRLGPARIAEVSAMMLETVRDIEMELASMEAN